MAMHSPSEFRLVAGVTPKLYNAVLPYLMALPETTQINVNNAAAPLLRSLSAGMTPEVVQMILQVRHQQPFGTKEKFLSFDAVKANGVPGEVITVLSRYFLLKTDILVGTQQMTFYTLLQRTQQGSQPQVKVLWQSKGTL